MVRRSSKLTYDKAREIVAAQAVKSKAEYYELCDKDNRLLREPDNVYKPEFVSWIHYLSIERKFYELEECKAKVAYYIGMYPEIVKSLLKISVVIDELCKLDPLFPPNDLWVEYYGVKDITCIIILNSRKKVRSSIL